MDISIVIPVYNGEETLKMCLDAVTSLKQPEGMNVEILLINDGSTDRTKEIASSYDQVRIIELEKNSGRIIARKTGAENAKYENLLFVDNRLLLDQEVLNNISRIGYKPLLAGEYDSIGNESGSGRFFYLIRRKVYKPYFPQIKFGRELWINDENFSASPKGTGCLFINKNLFLEIIPDKSSRETNDDTKLLRKIVFEKKMQILRHTDIKIKYLNRNYEDIHTWIYNRGKLWADYYLSGINLYSVMFAIVHITGIFCLSSMKAYDFVIVIFISVTLSAWFLAEKINDIPMIITMSLQLGFRFYIGIIVGTVNKVKRKLHEKPAP